MSTQSKEKITNINRNWYFETNIKTDGSQNSMPDGGIILNNLTNHGYGFAKDIRVVSIWVNAEYENAKMLRLNADDFELIKAPLFKINNEAEKPINQFKQYESTPVPIKENGKVSYKDLYGVSSVQAVYRTKKRVFEELEDDDKKSNYLTIKQTYVFTGYNDKPSHEPSGGLHAARLFPLIEIDYPEDTFVKSIRIDYRFGLSLDIFKDENDLKAYITKEFIARKFIANRPQQAGVFRDRDESLNPIKETIMNFQKATAEYLAFERAEKPLLYEICGVGLLKGKSANLADYLTKYYKSEISPDYIKYYPWDNVHWWSYRKDTGNEDYPSTPGAFHAVHFHWRWGKFLQDKSSLGKDPVFDKLAPDTGKSQFKGTYLGGPLLDPKIPIQTIKFAITKNNANFGVEKKLEKSIEKTFDTASPEIISDGQKKLGKEIKTELVLWFSCDVFKQKDKPIKGTTCIHGFFFAHEPERADLYTSIREKGKIGKEENIKWPKGRVTGTKNEYYDPENISRTWIR